MNDMQIIIEEIVNNIRAIDREGAFSPELMRELVAACVHAVGENKRHDANVKEERSVEGPWGLYGGRET
jgi:hypothetical protein